ncbi:DUF1876 domain-containing protein [Rhodococcus marinonascens]|uniref:DUF1876 domain-containing protein n=1 Tax=Rhodococcus marinonascens TaxID=38311 RepID=UPI000934DF8B|nr:DUF1876 domain-containing protein [Rhodococcus marinonascens]
MNEKKWSVDIVIEEHDSEEGGSKTRAQARLRTSDTDTLVGIGRARRNPNDPEIPEVGDELATARALADLSHQLIEATVSDLEAATHGRVHLTG